MTGPVRLRSLGKEHVPAPLRGVLRRVLAYLQRVGRWAFVLRELRGSTFADQMTLLASAAVSPIISLQALGRWQDPQLLFDAQVRVGGVGTFSLRRRTDDLWHVLPHRERRVLGAIRERLQPGDLFVDAGANLGFFTVFAGRAVGPHGHVLAVEMMPETAGLLRRHVSLNGLDNVTVAEYALSDVDGQLLTAREPRGKHGQASIQRDELPGSVREVEVSSSTFDALLEDRPEIAVLKMDLEGAEEQAVRGAARTLARTRCVILEDLSLNDGAGDAATKLLMDAGFRLQRIDGRNWIASR